eukprot:TRINITY_DN4138_c0_g1_i6.p1 TRINITY_DN4138_c0_g1~~TRINITY_DN4138_c0_g1_i6.p1  ORF type:complete len:526 (-),score=90.25 TRINITY_DN4138_c0_g1_i6:237-1658(-)
MEEKDQQKSPAASLLAFRPRTLRIAAKETTQVVKHEKPKAKDQEQLNQQQSDDNVTKKAEQQDKLDEDQDVEMVDKKQTIPVINKYEKKVFKYGNFPFYYNYRRDSEQAIDPRVKQFKLEWFKGKSVLDIGCHRGVVGLQVARLFCPRRYVGVDIDPVLIAKAVGSLNHFRRVLKTHHREQFLLKQREDHRKEVLLIEQKEAKEEGESKAVKDLTCGDENQERKIVNNDRGGELRENRGDEFEKEGNQKATRQYQQQREHLNDQQETQLQENSQYEKEKKQAKRDREIVSEESKKEKVQKISNDEQMMCEDAQQMKLSDEASALADPVDSTDLRTLAQAISGLDDMEFVNCDFMDYDAGNRKFGVVLCLSIAKWIHFHHGDEGVKNMFKYIGKVMNTKGILVLEFQDIENYRGDLKKCKGHLKFGEIECFKFLPQDFLSYLEKDVGFKLVSIINVETESKSNFQRSLHVLEKQ